MFLNKDSKRCSVDANTVSFFLPKKEVVPVSQHANNTQQIISIMRNHVHRGQPPVSVVVAVVVAQPPVVDIGQRLCDVTVTGLRAQGFSRQRAKALSMN